MTTIHLTGEICVESHGSVGNAAIFYGHWGESGVCNRVGDTWVRNLRARADTIAATEGVDTERGRVVQSGEHRGRQKSSIASEPPVSEVAGSSPAPAHPAPASPVVSAEAVEALAVRLANALPDSGDDCFDPAAYAGDPEAWENKGEDREWYRKFALALLADPADGGEGK